MRTRFIRVFAVTAILVANALHGQQVPSIITYQGRIAVGGVNFNGSGKFKFAFVKGGMASGFAVVAGGVVTAVSITNGGGGYVTVPAVTFSGGGGSGAAATATIAGGAVTGITVTGGGSGYASAPTVGIAAPPAIVSTVTYWSNDGSSKDGSMPISAVTLPVTNGLYSVALGDTGLANMTAIPASVFATSDVRLRVWFDDGIKGVQLLTPDQRIAAVGYAMIAATATTVKDGAITAAKIANGAAFANLSASGQSLVPSGGLILSPTENPSLVAAGFQKVGTVVLNEAGQSYSWQTLGLPTSGAAPAARGGHTALWSGNAMIVWGGTGTGGLLNDGASFNPVANSWASTSTVGAPSVRAKHTAVWTGSEMIVWGGNTTVALSSYANDGGRFNPYANTWVPTATTGAPAARHSHSAIWTGSEMIVWGGFGAGGYLNTGARFSLATNSWSDVTLAGAPTGRHFHTAVWTGSEMIVWGGYGSAGFQNTGARYNPTTNSWSSLTGVGAPTARHSHTAVWSGTEMIVWGGGGAGGLVNNGARYTPPTNSWLPCTAANAPVARYAHTAAWTGTEMIVWAGSDGGSSLNDGARYNPAADIWVMLPLTGAPAVRLRHTAIWSGTSMVVWGGAADFSGSYFNDTAVLLPARTLYLYQRP